MLLLLTIKNFIHHFSGLQLIHELTSRKNTSNSLRFDMTSYNGTHGYDTYAGFGVDRPSGYTTHLGRRTSLLHSKKYSWQSIRTCMYYLIYIELFSKHYSSWKCQICIVVIQTYVIMYFTFVFQYLLLDIKHSFVVSF